MKPYFAPALGAILLFASQPAECETLEEFYRGKQISIIIGFQPGGTYDTYSRLVAAHLSQHIPGRPTVVAKNLGGAGSFKAASFVYNQAPPDGTTIGIVNEGLVLEQVFATPNMDFDMGRFGWVGRVNSATNIGVVWHTARAKTIAEAMTSELITGSTGTQSISGALARMLNRIVGTKFKIVPGYGSARALSLAMERGEIEAYFTDATEVIYVHRDWLRDKKVVVPVQFSDRRHRLLPDTPVVTELARSRDEKQILTLSASISVVGKAFIAPPGLSDERLAGLRAAFDALLRDPAFLSEAQTRGIEIDPLSGAELQKRVQETLAVPPEIAARAARAWRP